jgi:haloalkane dehalogenase
MIVDRNVFIEQLLPLAAGRPLSDTEMNYYRGPFLDPPSRAPIWRLANDTPIGGEPPDVWDAVTTYSDKLQKSTLPKLRVTRISKILRRCILDRDCTFFKRVSPHQIGQEVATWLQNLPVSGR